MTDPCRFPLRRHTPVSGVSGRRVLTRHERAFFETLTSGQAKDLALMEGTFRGRRAAFLVQIMRGPDGTDIRAPVAVLLRVGDLEDCRGPFGDRPEVREK